MTETPVRQTNQSATSKLINRLLRLLLLFVTGLFAGTVVSAVIVGVNNDLRNDIRTLLNLNVAPEVVITQEPDTSSGAGTVVNRSGIGVDADPGGHIVFALHVTGLNSLDHFFFDNTANNDDFADIRDEVAAYGDEALIIDDVNNLITFTNVQTEIQRPGSVLELMMRSLYEILEYGNSTRQSHIPCLVMITDQEQARRVFVQLSIPPGGQVEHNQPYVEPYENTEDITVTCYSPPS